MPWLFITHHVQFVFNNVFCGMRGKNTVDWCYMMADIFRNDLIKQLDNFNPGRSKQKFTCLGCIIVIFGAINESLANLFWKVPKSTEMRSIDIIHTWLCGLGNKTKEMYYSLLSLKMIFFCFIPPSLGAKNEFNISKMVDWLKKLFHYCICLEARTMSREVYLRVTA